MKTNDFRQKINLGGEWSFRVRGGEWTKRAVPGSYHCVGEAEYLRHFQCNRRSGERVLLTFEGINYGGKITLNGTFLGETLPYCHYTYDITEILRDDNELCVLVSDINAPYGPTDGWCCYGGIIRAVYLTVVPSTYISDVYFRQSLSEDFSVAHCKVQTFLDGDSVPGVSLRCEIGGTSVEGVGDIELALSHPRLWSPDAPELYELCVYLLIDGKVVDMYTRTVGFKHFCMDGKRFFLNGKPFFIAGVCRHDLGNDTEGQTLSDEAIERDFRMIKDMGANFIRLVHYPHDKRVVELADRMGLLISEESGLWWSDMSNKTLTDGALEVLKKTIIRDRSNVSVAFWMGFNECIFTQEFLNASARICRELDADRYVSGANCMNPQMTIEMFDKANIDFYTFHPYGTDISAVSSGTMSTKGGPSRIEDILKAFVGKPLVFTEWGGWNVVDNPALFVRFCERMKKARDDGQLAGMIYWAFADMYEYNRGQSACIDGIQREGLVDIDRKPKINYYVYRDFLRELSSVKPKQRSMQISGGIRNDLCGAYAVKLPDYSDDEKQRAAFDYATEESRTCRGRFMQRKNRFITHGPCLPEGAEAVGGIRFDSLCKPIAINDKYPSFTANIGLCGRKLFVLGNVIYSLGIPIYGEYGEQCALITVKYSDGEETHIPLRNGIELLTVMTTYGSSVIDPTSPVLQNAITFSYDKNFENYRIYLMEIELDGEKEVQSVTFESKMAERTVLLYGLSVGL